MKLNLILTEYFCREHNIDVNANHKIEKVNANELIIPERIDLIAKIKYIEHREKGYDLTYIKELYTAHIESFSSGQYIEPGNANKNSINKYFQSFDSLIDNIKQNGFDENISVIPVGSNNGIMDGSHRVAIAYYFKMEVPIIRFDDLSVNYNTSFFRNMVLDEKYLDYLVTEYCKLKKNVYFACVWPRAEGVKKKYELVNLLQQSCKVIYEKKIKLNYNGLRNLIFQVYSSQEWVGSIKNHFMGANDKADACYDREGYLTAYVLECDSFEEILKLKGEIRELFQNGNHSIHITDNQAEVVQIAHMLLNKNSVDFLNYAKPDYYVEFNKRLDIFKKRINDNKFSLDEFIIDSSSILGLYGLRDIGDIDFISVSNGYEKIEDNDVNNHHKYVRFYETTISDLILNPDNYIVYNEMKFITLTMLRRFKTNRNESKDQLDVKIIDSALVDNNNFMLSLHKLQSWIRRKMRNQKAAVLFATLKILKTFRIYDSVKKIYHFIKGV